MSKLSRLMLLASCVTAVEAGAQSLAPPKGKERPAPKERQQQREETVPKRYLPPSGMCRIWVDNVPAGRQPAPTDCTTAIRNRPPNARVIFGPGRKNDEKTTPPRGRPDTTRRTKPPA